MTTASLAIHGGPAVRGGRPWPAWPEYDEGTEAAVLSAITARRWTVSWYSTGEPSLERRFAQAFACYHGVPWAVGVDHGSSALVVALEALDIGAGDEVVVPAVTWVATATAVLRVGALPVLVDIDPETGCLDPEALSAALSPRTRAVIVVHLACTTADIDTILSITNKHGIPLIEDCAQAHGAIWRGHHVGTWGAIGAFSFQTGKVLACGEGGAVITSDPVLYDRVQELRADSRRYSADGLRAGDMELVEAGDVMGANYTLSELQAAILLDRLKVLDDQHDRREHRAQELEAGLAGLDGGFHAVPVPRQVDRRSIYEFAIRFPNQCFGDVKVATVARAVAAELERPVYPPDAPLFVSTLFRPGTKRRFASIWNETSRKRCLGRPFPGALEYSATTLLFHHSALLGETADVDDIVRALEKVRRFASALSRESRSRSATTSSTS